MMAPVEALTGLEEDTLINEANLTLEQANEKLAQVSGDMLHIKLTVDISKASEFGINLKQGGKWDCTTYRYDTAEQLIYGTTENRGEGCKTKTVSGYLPNEDGTITMDIYVDRSLVEAFFMNIRRSPFALMWRILLPRQWDCLPPAKLPLKACMWPRWAPSLTDTKTNSAIRGCRMALYLF